MKQIYYTETFETINNENLVSDEECWFEFHYGEPEEIDTVYITDFDELYKNRTIKSIHEKGVSLFKKRPFIKYRVTEPYQHKKRVTKKNFVEYRCKYVHYQQNLTHDEALYFLPEKEYLDYLNDTEPFVEN